MDKVIGGSIAVALIAIALTLMTLSWRARRTRGAKFVLWSPLQGSPQQSYSVFYVATTLGNSSLERVALKGFSFRGFAELEVFSTGLHIRLQTGDVLAIPASALISYEFAQVAIDKVVEKDGLVRLTWSSESDNSNVSQLSTFVRLRDAGDRERLSSVLAKLVSTHTKEEVA